MALAYFAILYFQGRGYHISVDGNQISDATWCNISSQGIQVYIS